MEILEHPQSVPSVLRGGVGLMLANDFGLGCQGCGRVAARSGHLGRGGVVSDPDLELKEPRELFRHETCLRLIHLIGLIPALLSGCVLRLTKPFKRGASSAPWDEIDFVSVFSGGVSPATVGKGHQQPATSARKKKTRVLFVFSFVLRSSLQISGDSCPDCILFVCVYLSRYLSLLPTRMNTDKCMPLGVHLQKKSLG